MSSVGGQVKQLECKISELELANKVLQSFHAHLYDWIVVLL